MSKKLIFGQTYMKFVVAMATSKIAEDEWTATESFSPLE